jgi:hypothetical protein
MKFTSTTVAILSAMMAKTAFAANFNYGVATYDDGHQDHAIWVNGESACNYAFLGSNGENLAPTTAACSLSIKSLTGSPDAEAQASAF